MKNSNIYIVVGAVFAVALIAYAINPEAFHALNNQAGQNLQFADGQLDIGESFHSIIDKYAPNFIQDRRVDCTSIDGTWYDQEDKIGCFDVPSGSWDSSNCATYTIRYLQDICNSIGGSWDCTANNVGCSR
jgi:hypothetical protein